jgi:hypothetical protein
MSVLDHLKEYRVVKVVLSLNNGRQAAFDGVALVAEIPKFEVTFLPDQLNYAELASDEFCRVTFDVAGEEKSLKARIDSSLSDDKLLLEMVETYTFTQKREYFRVDADLSVSYWLADEESPQARSVRTSVNISGGGVRLPVADALAAGTRVGLEIVVAEPQPAVVECIGEVVGIYDVSGEGQLALRFVDIDEEGQDAIVAYCLAEQRRQLRLKVKVMGSALP